jgi:uncharacterized protein DUF2752
LVQRWPQHLKWIVPLAAVTALAVLYAFPPAQYAFYPQCVFRWATGFDCPGCGSLRSVHCLLHGEFAAAFRLNPLLYVLVPLLLICRHHLHKPAWVWSFTGVVLVFTILRNL